MTLTGKRIAILAEADYQDLELHYPRLRLIEEGAEVVVDGNLITSRRPEDLPAFMREVIRALKG